MYAAERKPGIYHFDPSVTPAAVFARFFGTANPYEALEGMDGCNFLHTPRPAIRGLNNHVLHAWLTRCSHLSAFRGLDHSGAQQEDEKQSGGTKPASRVRGLLATIAVLCVRGTLHTCPLPLLPYSTRLT